MSSRENKINVERVVSNVGDHLLGEAVDHKHVDVGSTTQQVGYSNSGQRPHRCCHLATNVEYADCRSWRNRHSQTCRRQRWNKQHQLQQRAASLSSSSGQRPHHCCHLLTNVEFTDCCSWRSGQSQTCRCHFCNNRTTALPMQQQQHHSPSVIPQQTLLIFSHDLLLHLKHCTNRAAVWYFLGCIVGMHVVSGMVNVVPCTLQTASRQHLCSAASHQLTVPPLRRVTHSGRAFAVFLKHRSSQGTNVCRALKAFGEAALCKLTFYITLHMCVWQTMYRAKTAKPTVWCFVSKHWRQNRR